MEEGRGGGGERSTEIELLEFSSDVAPEPGGLAATSITDQKHLELFAAQGCSRLSCSGLRRQLHSFRDNAALAHCFFSFD